MTGATGSNPFSLTNDNNGNVTKLPTTNANDTVSWNYDNKLKAAQKGTSSISVKYDPMGNRVWRQSTVDGVTTGRKYIVDISGQLPVILCEVDDPNSYTFGSLKTSYVYADGQILCQRIHTDPNDSTIFAPYYYVHDRLGSVRLMLDSEGMAINSYTYNPYGSFYEGEVVETVTSPWAFTGQYYDAEIAQYYLRARQYDPTMMRFTSRDPLDGQYDEPLTLHKYIYCLNEPMDRIDPSGEMSLPEEEAGLGVQGSLNAASNGYDYANRIKNYAQMVTSGASFQNVMAAALIDCATDMAGGKMMDFVGGAVSGTMNTLKEASGQLLSYKNLRKGIKGSGLEAHHLIERRFAGLFGMKGKEGDMLAVALSKEQHQKFTNAWRDAFGYGSGTKNASREGVESAARWIYRDCPEFLTALGL